MSLHLHHDRQDHLDSDRSVGTGGARPRPRHVHGAWAAALVVVLGGSAAAAGEPTPHRSSAAVETVVAAPAVVDEGAPSLFVARPSYRAYDSRHDPSGKWVFNELATIEVFSDEDGVPQITGGAAVTAVTFNVTVAATEGAGYVQVMGPGVVPGSTSTINWAAPGLSIANSGSIQVGEDSSQPGYIGIYLGGTDSAAAHVIIDITGYYIAPA